MKIYGAYISQLIRYARASSNYSDFLKRHLYLRNRLLDQGYLKIRLIRSLKKFIQLWRIYQWKKFCKSRIIDRYTVINIPVCEIKGLFNLTFCWHEGKGRVGNILLIVKTWVPLIICHFHFICLLWRDTVQQVGGIQMGTNIYDFKIII
jgi:hypothetical protein